MERLLVHRSLGEKPLWHSATRKGVLKNISLFSQDKYFITRPVNAVGLVMTL